MSFTLPNAGGGFDEDALNAFEQAEAAGSFGILPEGRYRVRVRSGRLARAKNGKQIYRMIFEVIEGEYLRTRISKTWWFTPKALEDTKRDLQLFGISTQSQLLLEFPLDGFDVMLTIFTTVKKSDGGNEFNNVRYFEKIERVAVQTPSPEPSVFDQFELDETSTEEKP